MKEKNMDILLEQPKTLPGQSVNPQNTNEERSRRIFAQEIYDHFKKPETTCTVEDIVEGLKQKPTRHFQNSLTISATNLTFEGYKLSTPEDVKNYKQRVMNLMQAHYYLNHGKDNDWGWIITIV